MQISKDDPNFFEDVGYWGYVLFVREWEDFADNGFVGDVIDVGNIAFFISDWVAFMVFWGSANFIEIYVKKYNFVKCTLQSEKKIVILCAL